MSRVYLYQALRTAIGQIGHSFKDLPSYQLGRDMVAAYLRRFSIDAGLIDGLVVGEIYTTPSHPSQARYMAIENGFRDSSWALNVSNNCASGVEAIIEAARQIICQEADLVMVVGEESLTNMPIWFEGHRSNPATATINKMIQTVKSFDQLADHGISLKDGSSVIFDDCNFNGSMATTAEIVAQNLGFSREQLDDYAEKSYRLAHENWQSKRIEKYIFRHPQGASIDENILDKKKLLEGSRVFARVPALFGKTKNDVKDFYQQHQNYLEKNYDTESELAVTALNSCPKSDGAGAVLVASDTGRKKLKHLEVESELRGWSRYGAAPQVMGLSMADALHQAAQKCSLEISQIDQFEIHEAFAATAMATYSLVKKRTGFDMMRELGTRLNPNGGSLAMGHPVGATGIRLLCNMQQALSERAIARTAACTVCAGGGVSASIVIEKAR